MQSKNRLALLTGAAAAIKGELTGFDSAWTAGYPVQQGRCLFPGKVEDITMDILEGMLASHAKRVLPGTRTVQVHSRSDAV